MRAGGGAGRGEGGRTAGPEAEARMMAASGREPRTGSSSPPTSPGCRMFSSSSDPSPMSSAPLSDLESYHIIHTDAEAGVWYMTDESELFGSGDAAMGDL